jgi:hypothetical protein
MVLNCHGFEINGSGGFGLDLGTGIRRVDMPTFAVLKGLVSQILIFACQAARI